MSATFLAEVRVQEKVISSAGDKKFIAVAV